MTITPATMYWLTRLDNISETAVCITVFSIIAIIITAVALAVNDPDEEYKMPYKKSFRISITAAIISVLIAIFVPTTKEMAMIYVVPQITESQVVKQDIPELYDLGINALKDWLKQTKDVNNE